MLVCLFFLLWEGWVPTTSFALLRGSATDDDRAASRSACCGGARLTRRTWEERLPLSSYYQQLHQRTEELLQTTIIPCPDSVGNTSMAARCWPTYNCAMAFVIIGNVVGEPCDHHGLPPKPRMCFAHVGLVICRGRRDHDQTTIELIVVPTSKIPRISESKLQWS